MTAHVDVLSLVSNGKHRYWDLRSTGARPLTVNRVASMHRQQWATHTREVRGLWWALALEAKIPHLHRARVIALPLHADKRTPQDVGACAPEVKAAVDGLVDARVLPGDDPRYLTAITFLPPLICGDDGLHLRVEEEV